MSSSPTSDEEVVHLLPDASTASSKTPWHFARRTLLACMAVQLAIIVLLLLFIIMRSREETVACLHQPLTYSPAQHLIEYETRVFDLTFHPIDNWETLFEWTPSEEIDRKWTDSYDFGIHEIPKSQAALLPIKTAPIPAKDGFYGVHLDVFHQVHCLNMIRQTLLSDHYPDMSLSKGTNAQHIAHCIQSIRQSLMCSGDITPLNLQWEDTRSRVEFRGDAPHTCVKYDKLRDWALRHQTNPPMNFSIHPPQED